MNMLPPPRKETRHHAEVVEAFLSLRRASAEEVIQSRAAARAVLRVRNELMWFLRDLTHLSLAEIGQVMGGRDATTVRHGIDQISDRIASDEGYRREMLLARAEIQRGAGSGMTPDLSLTAIRACPHDQTEPREETK